MPAGFGERRYRRWVHAKDLTSFRVTVQETDLLILARHDLSDLAEQAVIRYRTVLHEYITRWPEFQTSLSPLHVPDDAPPIIREMSSAAIQASVGPFATVAGAIAEYVGKELVPYSPDLLIENGGDIFAASTRSRLFGIYAGNSPLSAKIAIKLDPSQMPCGVCTSSGTLGHSLSFGQADVVIVIAKSTTLADAWATALGNMVNTASDIARALKTAEQHSGIDGTVVIFGEEIGAWGNMQFVKV